MNWKLYKEFKVDPMSAYAPGAIDIWVLQHSTFIFDNLFNMKIKLAEKTYERIEIDYTKDYKLKAIKLFRSE